MKNDFSDYEIKIFNFLLEIKTSLIFACTLARSLFVIAKNGNFLKSSMSSYKKTFT